MDWEANTKEAVNFGRFGCVEPTERDMGCADAWARDAPISVRERERWGVQMHWEEMLRFR